MPTGSVQGNAAHPKPSAQPSPLELPSSTPCVRPRPLSMRANRFRCAWAAHVGIACKYRAKALHVACHRCRFRGSDLPALLCVRCTHLQPHMHAGTLAGGGRGCTIVAQSCNAPVTSLVRMLASPVE